MNAYEARLLGIERGLMGLGRQAGELQRDTWAGLQAARELWQEIPPSAPAAPCTGSIAWTVTSPAGDVISGQALTIAGPGGFSTSGTTNASGVFTHAITAAGTYTATASNACYSGGSPASIAATCSANAATLHFTTGTATRLLARTQSPCTVSTYVPGVPYTATKGAVTLTGTAGSSGVVTWDVSAYPAGTWTITATSTLGGRIGYQPSNTATAAASCGTSATATVGAIEGTSYTCGECVALPIKNTLVLHTTAGNVTLTYDAAGSLTWKGTQTIPGHTTVNWNYTPGGVLSGSYVGHTITTTQTARACPPDPFDKTVTISDPTNTSGLNGSTADLTE
jgi:hypothetical protein